MGPTGRLLVDFAIVVSQTGMLSEIAEVNYENMPM